MGKQLKRSFRGGLADKQIFDLAQCEVERLIKNTTYPNFLSSEVYLRHVRRCQASYGSKHNDPEDEDDDLSLKKGNNNFRPSSPNNEDEQFKNSSKSNILPTLHEDNEFANYHSENHGIKSQRSHQSHQQNLHNCQGNCQHHQSQLHQLQGRQPLQQGSLKNEMRLTKDILMATQQMRALDVRPKPEAYAG